MTEREAALEAELKAARIEVKLLKEKVDALARMIYGTKSEKLDPNQLMLLKETESKKADAPAADAESKAGAKTTERKVRSKPSRPRLPDHLPVHEEVIDPEEVKACPQQWRQIGHEVSEQLDYSPGRFSRRRLVRRKFFEASTRDPVVINWILIDREFNY